MEDEQGGPSGNVLLQLEACGKRENIVCTKPVLIIVGHSVLFLVFVGLSLRSRLHRRANRAMKEVALFHDRLLDLGSVWASLSWVVGVVLTVLPGCEDTPLRFGFLVVHYTLRGVRVFLFVSVFVFLTAESVGRQATHRASQIGFFSACLFNLRVLLLLFDTSHYATARAVMHALLTIIFGVLIYNHWSRPHRPHNVGQGQELLAHFLTPTQRTHDEEEPSSSSVQPPTSHQNYHRPFVVRFASKWWRPARHSFSSLAYKRHLHPFGLVVALSTFVGGLSSLMEAIGSYNTCVAFRVIEYVFLYVLFPLALHYTLLMDYRMCESVLCRAEGFNNLKRIPYEKLKLGDAIASGSQGTVHQAEYEGQRVCVKKFYMPDQQRTRQKFEMEASMYGALDHPNIIQIIGICENEANVLLVLELCEEGDLYKYIHNSPKVLTYAMAQRFMRELASALDHVHSSTVAHRDLKTTNVLLKQVYTNLKNKANFFFRSNPPKPEKKKRKIYKNRYTARSVQAFTFF
eukprot:c19667_g2_i4.p1 GENE.c19667_g2_i4~~c19667_g2_i4.p1  ORF type:complete len:516 (-),score=95.01 c19667_g2_i4:814-2361(-)